MDTGEEAVERGWPVRSGVVMGAGCGVLGLFPLVAASAGRLPLQNLWRTQTMPNAMPWALVPLNQYYLPMILGLLIVPGLVAALIVRRRRDPKLVLPTSWGLLGFQVAALVQSFSVLVAGLRLTGLALAYVAGLAVVCLLGLGVAQAVLWLVASGQPRRAALGMILAAVPSSEWLMSLWMFLFGPLSTPVWLILATRWLPGLGVGLVLVWCALRGQVRVSTWIVGVLVVWLVPAVFDAVDSAVAPNTASQGLGAVVRHTAEMFPMFVTPANQGFQGAALALGIGLVGSLGALVVRRRRPAAPEPSTPLR